MNLHHLYEFCNRHKNIYCYGAGHYGRVVLIHLQEHGYDIRGFIVSDGKKNIEELLGKPVMEIGSLKESFGIIIAVGDMYRTEIEKELKKVNKLVFFSASESFWKDLELRTEFKQKYKPNHYVNVLMYHRIDNPGNNPWKIITSPENFDAHMRYIKENYSVIRFEDDWSNITEPSVVVTFDDGYLDNLTFALPILEKYKISATIFVSTGILSKGNRFWWDRLENIFDHISNDQSASIAGRTFYHSELLEARQFLYQMLPEDKEKELSRTERILALGQQVKETKAAGLMTDDLKRLAESVLITIGAHTVTHSSLPYEPYELKKWEICESKRELEKILGKRIDVFSYPLGDYDEETISILKENGFRKAATVECGLTNGEDAFRIPRNMVMDYEGKQFERFIRKSWCMFT